jgi:NADH-quinone oxidoreductase subunit G
MPKLKVDGVEIEVEEGFSVLQACEAVGIEIPRFCYHDKPERSRQLPHVPGRGRKMRRSLIASCGMPCAEDMKVFTDTPMVKKARKGVMEMLC